MRLINPSSAGGGLSAPTLAGINSITSATGQPLTLATLDGNKDVIVAPHGTGMLVVPQAGIMFGVSGTFSIVHGASGLTIGSAGGEGLVYNNITGSILPAQDLRAFGTSAKRWSQGFFGSSGINIGGSGSPTTSGEVTTASQITKPVTAIANAVATGVLTITVPNAAHSATLRLTLNASLGAGGAVGANEASACISYDISLTRTAGLNAVGTVSTAFGSAASAVAGATTCTVTAALSAVSGAVGASNTFTVNVTISRGGGASTNHTCLVKAEIINSNATGITVA